MPQPKAGGSFATAAYKAFEHPTAVEHIKANDIYNSGMIYSIKENAKKHNMSCKDYIYSEYFESEIEDRYKHVNDKKNLLKKYEDCL